MKTHAPLTSLVPASFLTLLAFVARWTPSFVVGMLLLILVGPLRGHAFIGLGPVPRADYQFQGTLSSVIPAAPPLVNLGGNVFTAASVDEVPVTVLRFARNDGLSLPSPSGLSGSGAYTIVILFEFDEATGWRRIIDFKHAQSDTGLYSLNSALNFYNVALGPTAPIEAGRFVQVVLSRDVSQNVVGYVDGVQQFSFVDSSQLATFEGVDVLRLFRDEDPVVSDEASAGSIARLRFYDGALSATEVAALDRLPGGVSSSIQFSVAQLSAPENAGFVTLALSRLGNSQSAASVLWFVSGGTATPSADYTASGGTISFSPGQTSSSFVFPLIDDALVEPDEAVQITLSNPTGAFLGSPRTTTLTITDNDVTTPPAFHSDLELSLTESVPEVELGTGFTLNASLFNRGPDPASNVLVRVSPSPGLLALSSTADSPTFYDLIAATWQVPWIDSGQSVQLSLNLMTLSEGSQSTIAEVMASSDEDPDSDPGNGNPIEDDMATQFISVLAVASADLRLTKTALPGTVGVEQQLPFYIRVDNLGPDDSKNIVIKDTLPAGMKFKAASPPEGTAFDEKKMEWSLPGLSAGRFFEIELLVTSPVPYKGKNVAEITATGVRDPNRTNNRSEADGEWILYSACGTVRFCHFGNGDPHTNAIVELRRNGAKIKDTRTDTQGTFCFKELTAGKYVIVAKPADPTLGIKDSDPEEVEFGDGKSPGAIQIASPWPVIRGRVRYPLSGPGVQDITVKLAGKDVNKSVKTDADGGFLFTDLADGDYTVTPTPPAAGILFNPVSAPVKFQSCVVVSNFVYYSDRIIVGRAATCDKPAKPVLYPGITLSLDGGDVLYTRALADGSFAFSNLVAGKYVLTANHPTYTFDPVKVEAKNKSTPATVIGNPKPRLLGARVVDPHGAPVPGVDIAIFPPGARNPTAKQTTDSNGNVLFQNVANGTWVVQPLVTDRKLAFNPAADTVAVGDPKLCRNHAVFVANVGVAEVVAIEVVQVVQDWRNSVPLIEGKQTLVRAFLKPGGTARAPVLLRDLRLKVTPAGGQPVNISARGSVTARANITDDKVRNHREASAAFDITRFAKGEVTLTLEWPGGVLTTSPAASAAGAVNNNATTVKFTPAPALDLKWLLLDWKFEGKKDAAVAAQIPKHRERLLAGLPTPVLRAGPKDQDVVKWTPDYDPTKDDPDVFAANTLLLRDLLADKFTRDEPKDSKRIYYTLVKGVSFLDNAEIGGNFVLIRADVSAALYRNQPVHEMGHALGRHHAVHSGYGIHFGDIGPSKMGACSEKAGLTAPDFPMDHLLQQALQPTLGPMREGDYRFVYGWDHSDSTYISPFSTAELMSYCSFGTQWTWPGNFTYTNLVSSVASRFGKPAARAPSPELQDLPGVCAIISGHIFAADGRVTLDPVWETLHARETELPAPGDYTLRVLAQSGAEIFRGSFGPDFFVDAEGGPFLASQSRFRFCLQNLGPIGAIEIYHAGELLNRRTASLHAPQVEIVSPALGGFIESSEFTLRWVASDLDGDQLRYVVDVSPDGGSSWSTLAQNISATELDVPVGHLPGNRDTFLRVTASDGLHLSSAERVFHIADHPPTLVLLSPEPGAAFDGGSTLLLSAEAVDSEDGELDASSIQWSSDRNGALGQGRELSLKGSDLILGVHELSVSAIDSAGHTVSLNRSIEVRPAGAPMLAISVEEENIVMRWPFEFEAFHLEASLSLDDPYWFPVALEPSEDTGGLILRLPITEGALFLKLAEPAQPTAITP